MKGTGIEWAQEIASWKNSGLSQSEYCRRRGIPVKRFTYRLMKSRRKQASGKRSYAGFIEVTREHQESQYSIRSKTGRELVIRGSIDARELKTLLEVLESC